MLRTKKDEKRGPGKKRQRERQSQRDGQILSSWLDFSPANWFMQQPSQHCPVHSPFICCVCVWMCVCVPVCTHECKLHSTGISIGGNAQSLATCESVMCCIYIFVIKSPLKDVN